MRRPAISDSPIVKVVTETGAYVEPPPPEVVETDPDLSAEDAEQIRRDYLLTRLLDQRQGILGEKR